MIGKVKTGTYFKGILSYNQKGKAIDKNVLSDDISGQIKELHTVADQNRRAKNKVKHFVLSFAENDAPDDYTLSQIGQEYLKRMGYGNNQYITYKHTDTGHMHLHIAVNRIDFEGKAVKDSNEKRKSREIIMDLEKKYKLIKTQRYSKETKRDVVGYKGIQRRAHARNYPTIKEFLKKSIWRAIKEGKPTNEKEFIKCLPDGAILQKNKAGNGYNIYVRPKDRKFKLSEIDRSLSFSKLQNIFKEIRQEQKFNDNKKEHKEQPKKTLKVREKLIEILKDKNLMQIRDLTKSLTNDEITYIIIQENLNGIEKIDTLAAGGIDPNNARKYVTEYEDKKSSFKDLRDIHPTHNRNKGKNNDRGIEM